MSDNIFPDYLTWRPVEAVGKRLSYVQIPAFAVSGLESVTVPDLVRQYCYTATSDFIIAPPPAKPSDADFTLCVKYRVGENVFRYKLWDGETDPHAPLYAGQVIKANFVFEIWNPAGSTDVTLSSALNVYVSQRVVPVDYRTRTPVANNSVLQTVAFSDYVLINLLPESPAADILHRFLANPANVTVGSGPTRVTNWANTGSAGASFNLDTDTGVVRLVEDDAQFSNEDVIDFDGADVLEQGTPAVFFNVHQFFAIRFDDLQNGDFLINTLRIGLNLTSGVKGRIINRVDSATYTATGDDLITGQIYYWHIYTRNVSGTFRTNLTIYDESGEVVQTVTNAACASVFLQTGFEFTCADGIDFRIPQFLGYLASLTDAEVEQTLGYLRGLYGGVSLPIDQNTNIAWLDNA